MEEVRAIIAPSVLASDLSRLEEESRRMVNDGSDYLHLDIMDGHFVPNISFGPPVVKSLRAHLEDSFFAVHMMVTDPMMWIEPFACAGVNSLTFHWETTKEYADLYPQSVEKGRGDFASCAEICEKIKAKGMQVGIALKPKTEICSSLEEVIKTKKELISMLLIMTVEPGFGGQHFMYDMMPKVRKARQLFPHLNIEVDGGVDENTVVAAAENGANVFVAGTSMFRHQNPKELMHFMRKTFDTLRGKW